MPDPAPSPAYDDQDGAPAPAAPETLSVCLSPLADERASTVPRVVNGALLRVRGEQGEVEIDVPRGSVPGGSVFHARYLTPAGARRVAIEAAEVVALSETHDTVHGRVAGEPEEVGERRAAREPVNQPLKGVVLQSSENGPRGGFDATIADISELGIAITTETPLTGGDRVVVAHPEGGFGSTAEVEVVHSGSGDGSRVGARFSNPSAGHRFYGKVIELETAARMAEQDEQAAGGGADDGDAELKAS